MRQKKQYYGNFIEIIASVLQGSVVGVTLFNLSISNLFFFIEKASIHNSISGNRISAWVQNVSDLIAILESPAIN